MGQHGEYNNRDNSSTNDFPSPIRNLMDTWVITHVTEKLPAKMLLWIVDFKSRLMCLENVESAFYI